FLLVSFDGHFGGRFFCFFIYLEACLEVLRKVSLGDRAGLATEASWLLPESHRRLGVCRRSGMQGYVLANDGGSGLATMVTRQAFQGRPQIGVADLPGGFEQGLSCDN